MKTDHLNSYNAEKAILRMGPHFHWFHGYVVFFEDTSRDVLWIMDDGVDRWVQVDVFQGP